MTATRKRPFTRLNDQEQRVAVELVSRIRQRFDGQLVSAILFGSRARGEAEPGSDMDILVVLSSADREARKQVRHLAVEVCLEYGIYPSTRVRSRAEWRSMQQLQTALYRAIRRDGIDLLVVAPKAG